MTPAETVNIDRGKLASVIAKKKSSGVLLSEQTGVSVVTISRIRNGKSKPTKSTIEKIAGALGVDPRELLEGVESVAAAELSPAESRIVTLFRASDQRGRGDLEAYAAVMADRHGQGEAREDILDLIERAGSSGEGPGQSEKTG